MGLITPKRFADAVAGSLQSGPLDLATTPIRLFADPAAKPAPAKVLGIVALRSIHSRTDAPASGSGPDPSWLIGSTILYRTLPVKTSKLIAMIAAIYLWGAHAMAADGLTTLPSAFGAKETMDRLQAEVKARGMTVFARVDHAAGAAQVGLSLRPTEVLIFGNAKAGTPLMQSNQSIGIDLPLKVLVW
jgi:hypothetical protein